MHGRGKGEHVLDVETLHLSHELPNGWGDKHAMRVACCVVHDVTTGQDLLFAERPLDGCHPIEALYHYLEACRSEGCTLVGHNIRGFDWPVLAGEWHARGLVGDHRAWHPGRARLLDTMETLHRSLGWRVGLHALAHHNLGQGKEMSGALAPTLWRQGEWLRVLAYCRRDVDLTRQVWLKGRLEGRVAVEQRQDGQPRYVRVRW